MKVTLFTAAQLACKPQVGRVVETTWERFAAWPSRPIVTDDKASNGGFVLAELRDGVRRNDHVVTVCAFGADHDAGNVSAHDGHAALAGVRHVVFTTHSHTPAAPRWRAILPFDRPATLEEYSAVYPVLRAQFDAAGIELDRSAKDGCRLWYAPAARPGAPFEVYAGDGPALEVDALLALARQLDEQRAAERALRRPPPPPTSSRRDRYIRSAVEREVREVAAGTPGERHYRVCKAAFALARFGLTEAEIADAIVPAAVHAMGEARRREVERAVRDAVKARGVT